MRLLLNCRKNFKAPMPSMVCLVVPNLPCEFLTWQHRKQHALFLQSGPNFLQLCVSNHQAFKLLPSWNTTVQWDVFGGTNGAANSRSTPHCALLQPKKREKKQSGQGVRNGLESCLLQRLSQTLAERHLLRPGQRVLLAISGGQDSTCLMHLLAKLQISWEWKIGVAHCDHQWSPSTARQQASHVAQMAQNLGLDYYQAVATKPVRGEGVARTWRYGVLQRIALAHDYEAIVTAHTATDRIETLLFNVFRGTGVRGLQSLTWIKALDSELGVAFKSAFQVDERVLGVEDPREGVKGFKPRRLDLVRPLLNVTRTELRQLTEELDLPLWPDPTNLEFDIDRNRIRNELLPYLRKHFNAGVDKSLARWAEILHGEEMYLDGLCSSIRKTAEAELELELGGSEGDRVGRKLDVSLVRSLPVALQRRILKQFVDGFTRRAIGFDIVERVRRVCSKVSKGRTGVKVVVPGGFYVHVCGDELVIYDPKSKDESVKLRDESVK